MKIKSDLNAECHVFICDESFQENKEEVSNYFDIFIYFLVVEY